ncbi:MAG: chemotaxis protein CheW [Oscillatoria sp. SIO1A7]|nr:chemotaxis protein CheW [Oscillatoria sp. SIO1A7]
MKYKSYLIFTLNGLRYGVETEAVREIFFLPELTPIEEAPWDIVGVLNLRGYILPVMSLALRFGYENREYKVTDSVLVLERAGFKVGIIVNEVHEVKEIAEELVEEQIAYGGKQAKKFHNFIAGFAKLGADIYMLLDPDKAIEYSDSADPFNGDFCSSTDREEIDRADKSSIKPDKPERSFCPNASEEERGIFRERAENLMRPTESEDFTGLMPLAVVGLNGEYFGIDLNIVREFTEVEQITPIPCVGQQIAGNINLRGEIVTLVDIRGVLNMPIANLGQTPSAAIVSVDDIVAGVMIDEVRDVMYLHPSQLTPMPAAVHSAANEEYLRGTAPYGERMMSLLDIGKMLLRGELEINEEV